MNFLLGGPLVRYVKLPVAHAPRMPRTFSRQLPTYGSPWASCQIVATHVPRCSPGSLTRGGEENVSRHSRCMCNPQFYVSRKRPIKGVEMMQQLMFNLVHEKGKYRILYMSHVQESHFSHCHDIMNSHVIIYMQFRTWIYDTFGVSAAVILPLFYVEILYCHIQLQKHTHNHSTW